jgi:secreted PhoX family phosphatase
MLMEGSITLASTVTKTLYGYPECSSSTVTHKVQIYVGKLGNAYFKNGEVAGETDFFYGFGTAWVEQTSIALRNCGGGITAWVSILTCGNSFFSSIKADYKSRKEPTLHS